MNTESPDAIIIGAGPCGLFQVFQLGLQGIRCRVFEAAAQPGGQCHELYADKPIYDIPGIPCILAGDLSAQLLRQIEPFDPLFSFSTTVHSIEKSNNGEGYIVNTSSGDSINAKYVIIATGAGAFTPVKMRLERIDAFEDNQLYYHGAPALQNHHTVVIGDTQAAVDTALQSVDTAQSVTYIHRKKRMVGSAESLQALQQQSEAGRLAIHQGKVTDVKITDNTITGLTVIGSDKQPDTITANIILARLGNSPKLHNYSDWGLTTQRNQIEVDSASFQSNLSGIFIIGDISSYPGKRKLILCGFHEATLVAFAIAAATYPDKPIHTQYTTTSTELLARLGVTN
ncbi:MAG: NAD(P)/FAD-dependent oxidoreductase [Pseudomonadota bacterium]